MATTPVFPTEIFQARRAEVLRRMREQSPGPSVGVFPATPVATRNNDVDHPYRADSDLFWLTGFEEPFHNLWRYYLMYCEGGFRGGAIDVAQVTMVKG